jgi:hypothetical protein
MLNFYQINGKGEIRTRDHLIIKTLISCQRTYMLHMFLYCMWSGIDYIYLSHLFNYFLQHSNDIILGMEYEKYKPLHIYNFNGHI